MPLKATIAVVQTNQLRDQTQMGGIGYFEVATTVSSACYRNASSHLDNSNVLRPTIQHLRCNKTLNKLLDVYNYVRIHMLFIHLFIYMNGGRTEPTFFVFNAAICRLSNNEQLVMTKQKVLTSFDVTQKMIVFEHLQQQINAIKFQSSSSRPN